MIKKLWISFTVIMGCLTHIQCEVFSSNARFLQDSKDTKIQQQYNKPKKQVFNLQNKGKPFGQQDQYRIKVNRSSFSNDTYKQILKKSDSWDKLQPNSIYDYLNITSKINPKQLSQKLFNSIAYELYTYPYNQKLQKKPTKLDIDMSKRQTYAYFNNWILGSFKRFWGYQFDLCYSLIKKPDDIELQKQSYIYYNWKHKFNDYKQQAPMCIFSMGHRVFSQNKHQDYFKAMQRMNYTNFHIVYVDDNSPQGQIEGILKHIQDKNYSIKNKMKIIHTLHNVGPLGNLYFWINKYCNKQDIVVFMDADDYFIGTQALKILNIKYSNPNTWVAYTRLVVSRDISKGLQIGGTLPMSSSAAWYRNHVGYWDVGSLRTLRKQLFQKMPIDMMIEYHLDQKQQYARPRFYKSAYDAYIIFNFVQMSHQKRIVYSSDFLYMYTGSAIGSASCYTQHQALDDFKSRIKTPFKPLNNLQQAPSHVQNYRPSDRVVNTLMGNYQKYRKCLGLPYP